MLAHVAYQVEQQPGDSCSQLLALSIAMEHPACSTHPAIICAATQTCKALQAAVRNCSTCNTEVVLRPEATLHQLRGFASWLIDHVQLVRSVTINVRQDSGHSSSTPEGLSGMFDDCCHDATASLLLNKTFQLLAAAGPDVVRSAASGRQQQQQQRHLLRFTSFTSDHLNSATMLAALPGQHLTRLELESPSCDSTHCTGALQQLSNLQQLQLTSSQSSVRCSCLAGIARLQQLTQLRLSGHWWESSKDVLQQLFAQPLPLRVDHVWKEGEVEEEEKEGEALDLSALVQLTELIASDLHPGCVLPAQLHTVQLGYVIKLAA
jgi:hypothetical protein